MPEKTLEEQANELLSDFAKDRGVTMRSLGIINRQRAARVNEVEIPMSSVWPNILPPMARVKDEEDDE